MSLCYDVAKFSEVQVVFFEQLFIKVLFLCFLICFLSRNERKLVFLGHSLVTEQENILTLQGFHW